MLFWTQVAAIGQVAGAIATFSAVLVSLYLARRDRSPRLRVSAGLRMIIPGDGSPATDIIAIKVVNVGTRAARIASVGWITGWLNRGPESLTRQFAVQMMSQGSPVPPFDLQPGTDVTFRITLVDFNWAKNAEKNASFFGRRLPWRWSAIPANIKVLVSVVGARDVMKRVEVPLAEYFLTGVSEGAARFNAALADRP